MRFVFGHSGLKRMDGFAENLLAKMKDDEILETISELVTVVWQKAQVVEGKIAVDILENDDEELN